MEIREAQQMVDQWIRTKGVRYFNPLSNMTILMEEVGELSRWMVREYGEQSYKSTEDPSNAPSAIAGELADILWVLICLANQTGIDLDKALQESMAKKDFRDARRHIDNPKLLSGSSD